MLFHSSATPDSFSRFAFITPKFIFSLVLLLIIIFASQSANAQESALDPTFDGDGRTTIDTSNFDQLSQAVAVQANGKLVIVADNTGTNFITTRLNADGSPDASFGTNGRVTTPIPGVQAAGLRDVAIQPDGKIIAAGYSGTFNFRGDFFASITVARYNTNGSLDDGTGADTTPGDSFGTNGIATFTATIGETRRIFLQPDGKILIGGIGNSQLGDGRFRLVRLNVDGSPDTMFDGDGVVFGSTNTVFLNDVVVQADGRIVVVGFVVDTFSGRRFVNLLRYNANGSLDDGTSNDQTPADTFGAGGMANLLSSRTPGNSEATSVILQSDGRIVISGSGAGLAASNSGDALIARFTTTGAPDTTFGTDGVTYTNFFTGTNGAESSDSAQAVVERFDGKLVLVGNSSVGSPFFAFTRYSADGVLDTTMGVNGRVAAFIPNIANVSALGATIQPDGKVVAVGQARTGDIRTGAVIPVVRLIAEPPIVTFNDDQNISVVNSLGIALDDTPNDGRCATQLFGSICTLQAALGQVGGDTITTTQTVSFNIPGEGTRTIPFDNFQSIPNNVTIDGYTQPGASANTLAVGSNAVMRIELSGGGEMILGGNITLRGLVINLNGNRAILIQGGNNVVEGCFIGTNANGTASASNRSIGIGEGINFFNPSVAAPNNRIGGATPAQRNVIFGFFALADFRSTGNRIENNYIGVDKTGLVSLGNSANNMGSGGIGDSATNTEIINNLISGNTNGIGLGVGGDGGTIQGNLIGTDITGQTALPNTGGIVVSGSNNLIGGASSPQGNTISGNTGRGIEVVAGSGGRLATNNRIQNNRIGVALDGTTPLGNTAEGIYVRAAGANNIIGAEDGISAGGNIIANNGFGGALTSGVFIPANVNGIRILSNSIYNNGGIGIDLNDGREPLNTRTPNDSGDPDDGGNRLQNSPLIQFVLTGSTRVVGMLNSTPNRMFLVQFFASQAVNALEAEGQTLLGSRTYMTDGSGNVGFDETFPPNTQGQFITSTATDLTTFDTSELTGTPVTTADELTIEGSVINSRGASVAGVTINLKGSAQMTTVTDANGRYAFENVPNGGIYVVTAQAFGKRFTPSSLTFASIVANQTADFTVVDSKTRSRLGGRSRSFN